MHLRISSLVVSNISSSSKGMIICNKAPGTKIKQKSPAVNSFENHSHNAAMFYCSRQFVLDKEY